MEIQVAKLRHALSLLEPAVPGKPTLPVLKNVRLGEGRVVATDLEIAILVQLPEVEEAMCLPYAEAQRFLGSVPGHHIARLTVEGKRLTIAIGPAQASFVVPAVEDYPPIPSVESEHEAAVDGDGLVRALSAVRAYVAVEDTRPVLKAVCLTLGESPEAAAADGFRLAWEKVPGRLPGQGQLLLPAPAVEALTHLWQRAEKPPELSGVASPAQLALAKRLVRLEYSQQHLRASFGEVALVVRLVQGTYPNYPQLIPSDRATVYFMAEELWRVLKGMEKLEGKAARLCWSGENLQVEVKAEEEQGMVTIPARCQEEGRIAFKIAYLLDYLKGKEGTVALSTQSPSQPGLFSYRGTPHFVLMPWFVREWGETPTVRSADSAGQGPSGEETPAALPQEATEQPLGEEAPEDTGEHPEETPGQETTPEPTPGRKRRGREQ